MSKLLTTESLSLLRDEFKNYEELEDFLAKYENEEFDFNSVRLEDNPDYPSFPEDKINDFNKIFKNNPKDEFSLAKILYEALPLNAAQASNNLYWLYLNLGPFFSYIKERWIQKWDEDVEEVKLKNEIERFILSLEPSQNSLIKSPIAGLWWAIHLTIDESLDDKYYYSKIFLSERNLRDKNFGSYQLIRDGNVLQAVLDFYNEYKDTELEGKRIGSEAIAQQMMKTLNQIGGLTILSYLSKEEVYQKLIAYKDLIFRRAREVQLGKKESQQRLKVLRSGEDTPKVTAAESTLKITAKKDTKPSQGKTLKYFNLRDNGEYNLTDTKEPTFDYSVPINTNLKSGDLLLCYNEAGYINRVKISELLKKTRDLYKNGVYRGNTINTIKIIPSKAIIGIIFHVNGERYFKAILSDQLKEDNANVGLQGYKTLYSSYDKVEYIILPMSIEKDISKLIFKSLTSSGKAFSNSYYKKEFEIINSFAFNIQVQ